LEDFKVSLLGSDFNIYTNDISEEGYLTILATTPNTKQEIMRLVLPNFKVDHNVSYFELIEPSFKYISDNLSSILEEAFKGNSENVHSFNNIAIGITGDELTLSKIKYKLYFDVASKLFFKYYVPERVIDMSNLWSEDIRKMTYASFRDEESRRFVPPKKEEREKIVNQDESERQEYNPIEILRSKTKTYLTKTKISSLDYMKIVNEEAKKSDDIIISNVCRPLFTNPKVTVTPDKVIMIVRVGAELWENISNRIKDLGEKINNSCVIHLPRDLIGDISIGTQKSSEGTVTITKTTVFLMDYNDPSIFCVNALFMDEESTLINPLFDIIEDDLTSQKEQLVRYKNSILVSVLRDHFTPDYLSR
jgi:hypothetical protein